MVVLLSYFHNLVDVTSVSQLY